MGRLDLMNCEFWQGKVMYSYSEQVKYLVNYIKKIDYELY